MRGWRYRFRWELSNGVGGEAVIADWDVVRAEAQLRAMLAEEYEDVAVVVERVDGTGVTGL